uniref:Cysteine dioxygenase n=1 Tax=Aplanochytrium stocchinoi TaxID=215587 RepID=A0A7S3PJT8_9STRA|mmetsp:Transcript_9177/g.11459  ORF Transcript_9177/g.11459 Transcript_9177/m.11459 type:complete len:234 (+) Transcript_9177:774-1475(+)
MCLGCTIPAVATRFRETCKEALGELDVTHSPRSLRQKLLPIYKLASEITLDELGITKPLETEGNRVSYIPVLEEEEFTIGIFIIPPGGRVPLHNHPDMCVVSRVLYGEMDMISLDWDSKSFHGAERYFGGNAIVKSNRKLSAQQTQILIPTHKNMHEIRVSPDSQGVALLDILTPNYSEEDDRPCTYFELSTDQGRNNYGSQNVEMKSASGVSLFDHYEGDIVTLRAIPEPIY